MWDASIGHEDLHHLISMAQQFRLKMRFQEHSNKKCFQRASRKRIQRIHQLQ